MLRRQARKPGRAQGFTLIETVFAIVILTIGVLAMAALGTKMMQTGQQSKYMSVASQLASEKLEDLSHWSEDDPHVCVPVGNGSAGSLGADILQQTTCPPDSSGATNSGSVSYYDDVNLAINTGTVDCPNSSIGCFSETVSGQVAGVTQYTQTYHSPDGVVVVNPNAPAPVASTFHRRWVVEADSPVAGVRRITVLVTLTNAAQKPGVTFQMSTVRP